MAARPVVGVTGPDRHFPWGWWATRSAIRRSGGRPLRLTPRGWTGRMPRVDALVIGGGSDIDPALYGFEGSDRSDPERDRFELAALELAAGWGIPLLGICRGAQLINVVHGGNLLADVRPLRRHTSNRPSPFPVKEIAVQQESRLHGILGRPRLRVNSLHRQAVDRLGQGFRVSARDQDRIVQAIEGTGGGFCLGVQWHPEYLAWRRSDLAIFRALVAAA